MSEKGDRGRASGPTRAARLTSVYKVGGKIVSLRSSPSSTTSTAHSPSPYSPFLPLLLAQTGKDRFVLEGPCIVLRNDTKRDGHARRQLSQRAIRYGYVTAIEGGAYGLPARGRFGDGIRLL